MMKMKDVLKNVGNQHLLVAVDFHSSEKTTEERNSHRFGTTWGWVNDDNILIFSELSCIHLYKYTTYKYNFLHFYKYTTFP